MLMYLWEPFLTRIVDRKKETVKDRRGTCVEPESLTEKCVSGSSWKLAPSAVTRAMLSGRPAIHLGRMALQSAIYPAGQSAVTSAAAAREYHSPPIML